MSATLKPRWGHSLTAFSLGPGLTEVTVFGGSPEPLTVSDEIQPKLADTTLLQFSEWLIVCYHMPLQYVWTLFTECMYCNPHVCMYKYNMYVYIHMYMCSSHT